MIHATQKRPFVMSRYVDEREAEFGYKKLSYAVDR